MGKVIDLPVKEIPVSWTISVNGHEDFIMCRYKDAPGSVIGAHWGIYIETATIDRLPVMFEKAKAELAKSKAAMWARKRSAIGTANIGSGRVTESKGD